jgi:hypothetical protein
MKRCGLAQTRLKYHTQQGKPFTAAGFIQQ